MTVIIQELFLWGNNNITSVTSVFETSLNLQVVLLWFLYIGNSFTNLYGFQALKKDPVN